MIDSQTTIGMVGHVELLLVDKATNKVVKHVRKKNAITEPFARWLMTGNMAVPNSTGTIYQTGTATSDTDARRYHIVRNLVSDVLGSHPRDGYQAIQSFVKGGMSGSLMKRFAVFLMSDAVDVNYATEIPPYLNNLFSGSSQARTISQDPERVDNPLVIFRGDSQSENDGAVTMALDDANCRWGRMLQNPMFTTTYVKNAGYAEIRSVVLGAAPENFNSAPGYFMVTQSAPVVPEGWDDVWQGGTSRAMYDVDYVQRTLYERISESKNIARYLIHPFVRTGEIRGRFGDGIYTAATPATGMVESNNYNLAYFDLATKQRATTSPNIIVGGSGEDFSTNRDSINANLAGGFVLGAGENVATTRAIRLGLSNPGTNGNITIYYQTNLSSNTTSNVTYALQNVDDGTDVVGITGCAPVMVAKRGAVAEEDTVEIFATIGRGTYGSEVGFDVRKITIKIDEFRRTGTPAALTSAANLTDHGRVAVSPVAIGQQLTATSNNASLYCNGTLVDGEYYLPFTHLLTGFSVHNWEYNPLAANAGNGHSMCANANFQPGAVFDEVTLTRLRDFVFGYDQMRRMMLCTDEGMQPILVNQSHRWATSFGSVISGVSLDEPVIKTEEQILVVRYTYTFDITPQVPEPPTGFSIAPATTTSSLTLSWLKS